MKSWRGIFFYLFPSKPKPTDTEEGAHLRRVLWWCIFFHVIFFMVSLTIIGFLPMLAEIYYVTWLYSTYLTLREWSVIIYLLSLLTGVIYGALHLFYLNPE